MLAIISLGAVNAQDNSTSSIGENFDGLTPNFEVDEDISNEKIQTDMDDKLTMSEEVIVEDTADDNITVDVSNVFKGQNVSISVTVPEAKGIVNITVGEKLYSPEFIGGVATQSISEYSVGLNNVTVKYNDIVKETSFKVLDGVITNESFDDYFEISGRYYYLRSFIPEGITLDFRGYIYRDYMITGAHRLYITKPCNITSTTGDGEFDILAGFIIESGGIASNVSNIKIKQLSILASYCSVINFTGSLSMSEINDFKIIDSTINVLNVGSNLRRIDNLFIINCTVNQQFSARIDYMDNVSVINSTFNNGFSISCDFSIPKITNINIKNCIIDGLELWRVKHVLIENCTLSDNIYFHYVINATVKNNFINASSSTYGIKFDASDSKVIDNRIYSKYYCGESAIKYSYDAFWPENNNVFENNTPMQTDLNMSFTANTIFYDENTTIVVNMPKIEGNVVFHVNNEKISTVKLIDGIATLTIDKYELGVNNVSAVYEDLVKDLWGINYTSFKVNKVNYCPVNFVYEDINEGKLFTIDVVLPNDANGTITLTLNNDTHRITIKQDANGTNNIFNILALLEGNYTMSATFESVKYVTNSTMVNIRVVHIPVYRLDANNVVMDYKDESKYKVLVTKDGKAVVGETVKITFNGKTNNVKTDKNGYATLILDAAPKAYSIKAVYGGISKSSKVTIKNILKSTNISKKKVKIVKFSATLKTSKGKAVTGKKITFKLKGKIYSAKTNKKGVATISLKNLKVGKYTIISKYGACTVKNTIKIKK